MMEQFLEKAHIATKENDWSLVNDYLQKVLLSENPIDSFNLDQNKIKDTLNLALNVLEYGDFEQRWDVAKLIPKLGNIAIKPLINILADESIDRDHKWFISKILRNYSHPQVISSLINLLHNTEDEDLMAIASDSLVNICSSSLESITKLLDDNDTRLFAVNILAQIRTKETIKPLLTVVEDENSSIRAMAMEALGSFHNPKITPVLINALQDKASIVRKEAITALGYVKDCENLLNVMQPLLFDLNLEVCQQTAISISRFKTKEAAIALFKPLRSEYTPISLKISLIQALAWMETEKSLSLLEEALPYFDEKCVLETIKVLGRIKKNNLKSQASLILVNFFDSSSFHLQKSQIKQALAYSWGILSVENAHQALKLLQQDKNLKVRLHAKG